VVCYSSLMPQEGKVDLSGLLPGLDPSKLDEAEANLEAYLGVVFQSSDRKAREVPSAPVAEPVVVR
jgi:hypothetical protein